MSGPTYRIDVSHRPESGMRDEWVASVVRISDGLPMHAVWGHTAETAARSAQSWVAQQFTAQPGFSLFVGDDGRAVEGHSVKAPQA